MHSVTVVVPIFKPCSFRSRNLNFLVNELNKLQLKVIVAEQTLNDIKSNWFEKLSNINQINFEKNTKHFHKTYLCNKIIEHVETEYIWFIDSDFYTDFTSVLRNQKYTNYDFFKPFNTCKDLNEFQTQQLVETKYMDENMLKMNMSSDRSIKYFGALSYICKVSSFRTSGQLDEKYTGWGYEDLDLFLNIYNQKYSIGVAHDVNAVHMWHPPTVDKAKHMLINKKYFESKGYTIDKVKQAHRELFESKTVTDY